MQDFTWRGLLRLNFDKIVLLALIVATGTTMVLLARWNIPQEIIISIKDSYSGLIGALIALVTSHHDGNDYGAVLTQKTKGGQ